MFWSVSLSGAFLKNIFKVVFVSITIFILAFYYFDVPRPIGSVIVPIMAGGGLGNQMFRYAAGYALAKKTGSKLYVMIIGHFEKKIPLIESNVELIKFNIDKNNIISKNKINRHFLKLKNVNDQNFFELSKKQNYQVLVINDDFESEIFFKDVKNDILKMFNVSIEDKELRNVINDVDKQNSVCVHVRRGDMFSHLKMYLMPITYQIRAIELAKKFISNPKFFIFSDSIDIIKNELKDFEDLSFISKSVFEDFVIMSKCGNNIIANSTFSWWAAYVNKNRNHLVFAPYPRFTNSLLEWAFKNEKRRKQKHELYDKYAYPQDWITIRY